MPDRWSAAGVAVECIRLGLGTWEMVMYSVGWRVEATIDSA